MKHISLFTLLIGLLFFGGCKNAHSHEDGKAHAHPHKDSTAKSGTDMHADHPHAHEHSHANEYMNQSKFEELVVRFEEPERLDWQRPAAVIQMMNLPGKTVADIGAGTGYFAIPMAGIAQKVIAVDIDDRFLDHIEKRKNSLDLEVAARIETRKADTDNPYLKPGEVDLVLTVNTYHHISDRIDYFKNLKKGFKKEGQLWIIDFKPGELPMGPPAKMKIAPAKISAELKAAGYKDIKVDNETLNYQFILTARP